MSRCVFCDKKAIAGDDVCESCYADVKRSRVTEAIERMSACAQCGAPMNPVERMLGPVCGKCCRANHKAVAGGRV